MKCHEYVLLISGQMDGANTTAQETELKKHLNECEECRKMLEQMQENDRLLKAEIEVPDLSKSIMAEVRKNKRSKKPFYISLAASGLAAAAALALVFGGKSVTPQPTVQIQETQAALSMRSLEQANPELNAYGYEEMSEDFEDGETSTDAGAYFDHEGADLTDEGTDYAGLLQVAPTSEDIEKVTVSDEFATLVIHADPSEIEFEGTSLSMRDLASLQSKVDYKFSNNVTAVYSVSWEVLEQIAADCDGVLEMEKRYDENTIYYNAIVVFVK